MYKGLKRTWLYTISQSIFIAYNFFIFLGACSYLTIYETDPEVSTYLFDNSYKFKYVYGSAFFEDHLLYCVHIIAIMVLIVLNIGLKFYMIKKNKKLSSELKSAMCAKESGEMYIFGCKVPRLLVVNIVVTVLTLGFLVLWLFAYPSETVVKEVYIRSAFVVYVIPVCVGIIRMNLRIRKYKKAFAAVQTPSSPQPEELGDMSASPTNCEGTTENQNADAPKGETEDINTSEE